MQARRGAVTLFSDIIYADVSNYGSFASSKTFSPHVSGTLGATLSADYRYWIVEAGGMYETNRWNFGNNYGGETDTWLEILAGGRYWHQELDVDVALAGTLNVDGLVVSGSQRLGALGRRRLDRPLHRHAAALQAHRRRRVHRARRHRRLRPRQPVHLAGDRHLQLVPLHARRPIVRRLPGCKALSVDYDEGAGAGRYEFDVLQQGPVLGITGRF